MYDVYLEKAAERDLKRLQPKIFQQIIFHIKGLVDTPRPSGCHKIAGTKSDWRIRIGDYRVIYVIDDKAKVIKVMRVRHRREVYR